MEYELNQVAGEETGWRKRNEGEEIGARDSAKSNPLSQCLHMISNKVIAAGVIEYGKAPWIPEGDEVRFAREEVDG